MNHTIVLLASLADVWHQRRRRERGDRRLKIIPEVSDEQKVVVEIVYAIKVRWCIFLESLSYEDGNCHGNGEKLLSFVNMIVTQQNLKIFA